MHTRGQRGGFGKRRQCDPAARHIARFAIGRQQRRRELAVKQRRGRRLEPLGHLQQRQHRRSIAVFLCRSGQHSAERVGFCLQPREDRLRLACAVDRGALPLLRRERSFGRGKDAGAARFELRAGIGDRGGCFRQRGGGNQGGDQRFALALIVGEPRLQLAVAIGQLALLAFERGAARLPGRTGFDDLLQPGFGAG